MISNLFGAKGKPLIAGVLGAGLFVLWPEWRVYLQGSGYYGDPVEIDIKPNSDSNRINLRSNGKISVAVLTTSVAEGDTADFDALQVDPLTVVFGPNEAAPSQRGVKVKDVDRDGDSDLVFTFRIRETGIQCDESMAVLSGETYDKTSFMGADSVAPTGCGGGGSSSDD